MIKPKKPTVPIFLSEETREAEHVYLYTDGSNSYLLLSHEADALGEKIAKENGCSDEDIEECGTDEFLWLISGRLDEKDLTAILDRRRLQKEKRWLTSVNPHVVDNRVTCYECRYAFDRSPEEIQEIKNLNSAMKASYEAEMKKYESDLAEWNFFLKKEHIAKLEEEIEMLKGGHIAKKEMELKKLKDEVNEN